MRAYRAKLAMLSAVGLLISACGASASPSAPPSVASTAPTAPPAASPTPTVDPATAEWDALVAAAQAEGEVVLVGGPEGAVQDGDWYAAFGREFGIKTTLVGGPTGETTARVLAEVAQGVYSIDVASLGGSGTRNFLEANLFIPLEPQIIHPEALDRSSGWRIDREVWSDAGSVYCQMVGWESQLNLLEFYYNTEKVTPEELESIQSWQDILDPRWAGRIVIGDIASGENSTSRTYAWMFLGPEWLDALLRNDPTVVLYGDERSFADGLSRGAWSLGVFTPGTESIEEAIDNGLPVAEFPRTLEDGALHAGGQRICQMVNAPHPNAAKLFVNWAFTRAGGAAFNEFTGRVGRVHLRSDVPQGNIDDETWERANEPGPFIDENTPEYLKALDDSEAWLLAKFEELKIVPGS